MERPTSACPIKRCPRSQRTGRPPDAAACANHTARNHQACRHNTARETHLLGSLNARRPACPAQRHLVAVTASSHARSPVALLSSLAHAAARRANSGHVSCQVGNQSATRRVILVSAPRRWFKSCFVQKRVPDAHAALGKTERCSTLILAARFPGTDHSLRRLWNAFHAVPTPTRILLTPVPAIHDRAP